MTKQFEREEAYKLFEQGMKITDIAEKLNISRPTLNRWGINKAAQEQIGKKLIEEGRLAGVPAEDLSVSLEAPVRKIKHLYKEEAVKEAKRLRQPIETYTEKIATPTLYKTRAKEAKLRQGKTETLEHFEARKKELKYQIGAVVEREILLEDKKASYPGIFDLWGFVTGSMKTRYLLTTEEGLFASSTLNIPYVRYQPAKRIYLTSKSLFEWKLEKYGKSQRFIPESNFVKLNNPDPCLIAKIRHDVDTINATVGLPQNDRDYEIVREDACIISQSAAKRLTFTHLKKIIFMVDSTAVLAPKRAVKEGDILGEDMEGNEFISLYNGILSITNEKEAKGSGKKVIAGNIRIERAAGLGDKITGLTGLKVVIGEVRQDLPIDIIISENQIWNTQKPDGQRGGMVKELLTTGKIMIGLRQDTLLENQATRNKGASLSSTLYPVLALNDIEVTKDIIKDNSRFNELLKTLHLKYDAIQKRFTLLSEKDIDLDEEDEEGKAKWIEYPHYCYTETEFKKHFEATKPQKPFKVVGIDFEGKQLLSLSKPLPTSYVKIAPARYVVWDYCYNPSFMSVGYLGKKGLRENALFEPLKKGVENTLADRIKHVKAKFPFATIPKRTQTQKEAGTFLSSSIQKQIENQVFCDIRNGYYLVAIPSVDLPPGTIEINNPAAFGKEYKGSLYAMVIREPVVSKGNIASVKIKHNPDLPLGVVKVSLAVMKACSGDYDGDRLALIPYHSKNFIPAVVHSEAPKHTRAERKRARKHKEEKKEERKEKTIEVFLKELEPLLKERSEEQLKEEAFAFMVRLNEEKRRVERYGGLRKKASFRNPETTQNEIIDYAAGLETILKAELKDAEWRTKLKEEENRLKELSKQNYTGKGDLHSLFEDSSIAYRRLLGFKPPRFWEILFGIGVEDNE